MSHLSSLIFNQQAAVSIPGARVALETQRAKHEAARRRLQASENANRALRQSEAEAQVRCDLCFVEAKVRYVCGVL